MFFSAPMVVNTLLFSEVVIAQQSSDKHSLDIGSFVMFQIEIMFVQFTLVSYYCKAKKIARYSSTNMQNVILWYWMML